MKSFSFLTSLVLFFAVPASAFAQDYYDDSSESDSLVQRNAPSRDYYRDNTSEYYSDSQIPELDSSSHNKHISGIGINAFFAESDFSGFKDAPDFYGLNVSYLIRQNHTNNETQTLSPEFFISGGFGFGYGDIYSVDYGYEEYSLEYEVRHFMCTLGANLRYNIGSAFSLYVGARMGGEAILFSVDDGMNDEEQDSDFGLTYGFGMGCSLALSESVSMTLVVEHLNSEAEPEFLGRQTYNVYSFGLNFMF